MLERATTRDEALAALSGPHRGIDAQAERSEGGRRRHQDSDESIGRQIRIARRVAGLSQTALGRVVKVSFQQIQKYELGKDRVSASSLKVIAEVLGRDLSFFFDAADLSASKGRDLAEAVQIIRAVDSIKDKHLRRQLMNFVKAVAEAECEAKKIGLIKFDVQSP